VSGKRHCHWVKRLADEHLPDGALLEGPHLDGKQSGLWVMRFVDGTVFEDTALGGELKLTRRPESWGGRHPAADPVPEVHW